MAYRIEYGPADQRKQVDGLTLKLVLPTARLLEDGGQANVQIIGSGGNPVDWRQFELDDERGGVRFG